jgi:hypothetical protein
MSKNSRKWQILINLVLAGLKLPVFAAFDAR